MEERLKIHESNGKSIGKEDFYSIFHEGLQKAWLVKIEEIERVFLATTERLLFLEEEFDSGKYQIVEIIKIKKPLNVEKRTSIKYDLDKKEFSIMNGKEILKSFPITIVLTNSVF